MVTSSYVPDNSADLIWLNFSPQAGSEQAGRRPAVVLSPAAYNSRSHLALVCPPSGGRLQENLKKRGSVGDDQRLFLLARTAAAGVGCGRTELRFESRLSISSGVGRPRACRNSRSR